MNQHLYAISSNGYCFQGNQSTSVSSYGITFEAASISVHLLRPGSRKRKEQRNEQMKSIGNRIKLGFGDWIHGNGFCGNRSYNSCYWGISPEG